MADVIEMTGRQRRMIRKATEDYVATREERERLMRAIIELYWAHRDGK